MVQQEIFDVNADNQQSNGGKSKPIYSIQDIHLARSTFSGLESPHHHPAMPEMTRKPLPLQNLPMQENVTNYSEFP